MPRGYQDPIAQQIALAKEARAERTEERQATTAERSYGLDVAKFGHQQAHDAATLALDQQRTNADMVSKFTSMAKERYELTRSARREADVGHFYTMLTQIDPGDPDAANKIGYLKAKFPQAMQDEGVRATLSNDWSAVLSQRGLSRADRQAADNRKFLMDYAAAEAKDDEYGKRNPELKQIRDMAAKELLSYEQQKRGLGGATGAVQPAAPAPLTVDALFSGTPRQQPAAAAPATTQQPTPLPTEAAPAPAVETAPAATPAPTLPTPTLGAVPPASTPKEQSVAEWAATNPGASVASDRSEINDMLNQSPETQILAPNPSPTPVPTPPPQSKKDEEAAV